MKGRITKKDLGYWILILVGIIVTILTIKLADNATAVDYIGFAGTITSILLAVVALMYSFYQNNTYESSTQKLEVSAKKIKTAVKELDQVSEFKETVNSMREESNSIAESIKGLQEVVSTIESGVNRVNTNLENTREHLFKNFTTTSMDDLSQNDSHSLSELVKGLNLKAYLFLYVTYKMYQEQVEIDLDEFSNWYTREILFFNGDLDEKTPENFYQYVNFGMLVTYQQIGFITFQYSPNLVIEAFNPSVLEAIQDREEQLNRSNNTKKKELLLKVTEFVNSHKN